MNTKRNPLLTGTLACAIAVLTLLPSAAILGADPAAEASKVATNNTQEPGREAMAAKETAKEAASANLEPRHESLFARALTRTAITGGIDPHGNSLQSIQNSLGQFAHPEFMLRLFLSLSLAVVCARVIAWHPRRLRHTDLLSDIEERKTFIILGMVGAIVAELSGTSPTLAFVIFGIGALLRFRTLLDNPKSTGKAILVVVIGLACGMGSWSMAVFVTAFSWLLIFWLDSHTAFRLRVRLSTAVDAKPVQTQVQSSLAAHHCRLQSCTLSKGNRRMEFLFYMPAQLDVGQLETDVKAKLPKSEDIRISIEAV